MHENESATEESGGALREFGDLGRRKAEGTDADAAAAIEGSLERLGISKIPDFALVPRNLATAPDAEHLVYERESLDLQVLARQVGLKLEPIAGSTMETVHENDATIILPALIFLGALLDRAETVLEIIELFKKIRDFVVRHSRKPNEPIELSQEIFIHEGSHFERVSFKGPPSALPDVVESLKQMRKGENKRL